MSLSFTKQIKYFDHLHSRFQIFHIINHLKCSFKNHSIYAFAIYQRNERFSFSKKQAFCNQACTWVLIVILTYNNHLHATTICNSTYFQSLSAIKCVVKIAIAQLIIYELIHIKLMQLCCNYIIATIIPLCYNYFITML